MTDKKRKLSFREATARYVHRYTMDHVPAWSKVAAPNGKHYAPQYASDREWYDCTLFPGESEFADRNHCYSTGQTWPLGTWLDRPFGGRAHA